MSLTSYRAAPPRVGVVGRWRSRWWRGEAGWWGMVGGPGGDLLSHVLRRSTMGAAGFHGRVRNGIGWGTRAIGHQVEEPPLCAPHQVRDLAGTPQRRRPIADGAAPLREGSRIDTAGKAGMGSWWLRLSLAGVEVDRAIRTGQLRASPHVHTRPIDVVVYHGSDGETWFCGRFPA